MCGVSAFSALYTAGGSSNRWTMLTTFRSSCERCMERAHTNLPAETGIIASIC